MDDSIYVISQVVEKTNIKPHTIRYWEDELELTINRNNMGHRCYNDENISLFLKIKELKDLGYQLKAIKLLLPDIKKLDTMDQGGILRLKDEMNLRAMGLEMMSQKQNGIEDGSSEADSVIEDGQAEAQLVESNINNLTIKPSTTEKMNQFQSIMKRIMLDAVRENNIDITDAITEKVTDAVVKEMDYLLRIQEDREEERFKKLDETIRGVQKSRQEVAATSSKRKKKRLFGKEA